MVGVKTAEPGKQGRKSVGRPGGRPASREEILEAAERHFAERGYAAANLREIASDAGVTQAMVKYYFGSKLDMFKEVYLQRGNSLAEERMSLLEAVVSQASFGIEDVVRAYLIPSFKLRDSAQGRAFLRLQARLHAESDDIAYQLRREAYDRPVRAYVATLLTLLPDKTEEVIYLRFAQLIGIYIYIVSDMHRIEEISGVTRVVPSTEALVEEIVVFAAAGFRG
jgi:AcrR family transcriptional regulator